MSQTRFKKRSQSVLTSRKLAVCIGLILVLLLLPACGTVKYVKEAPPHELLLDCPTVIEKIKTNGELAETILAYRNALKACNIDKESLREWAKE